MRRKSRDPEDEEGHGVKIKSKDNIIGRKQDERCQ
jgi:hypothetical protein